MRDTGESMDMPTWWAQRRYGMLLSNGLANVPAWSPLGQDPLWYRHHLGEVDNGNPGAPLVETLAHHRDRWGHITRFDEFASLLSCEDDAPEAWVRLAVEAGMAYSIVTAKHHDGWCWWDAPDAVRSFVHEGPRRDIVAAHAAACERNGLAGGVHYSHLDWSDPRFATSSYTDEVLRPHLVDLVNRYRPSLLWGLPEGSTGLDSSAVDDLLEQLWSSAPDLIVNDAWTHGGGGHSPTGAVVRTFRHQPPPTIQSGPWTLCRGIGRSLGYNRAEQADHLLSPRGILALYTEVLAKGGSLLLAAGMNGRGAIPVEHAEPLVRSGPWIGRHAELLDRSRPWTIWGDADVRYLQLDDDLVVIDLSGAGRAPALTPEEVVVTAAVRIDPGQPSPPESHFVQDSRGLRIGISPETAADDDPVVWRLRIREPERPIELFAPVRRESIDITALLLAAQPGDVVQLGDGSHHGMVTVPESVTLRGLGGDRTVIHIASGEVAELRRNARLEHASVGPSPGPRHGEAVGRGARVVLVGEAATVLGCEIDGVIEVRADDATVRASRLGRLVTKGADRLSLSHCELTGDGTDIGVLLRGGGEHHIDSCEFSGHRCAVRADNTTGTAVHGNNISAGWWGVRLEHTETAHVHGNQIRDTMRAVDVDGGTQAQVDGNAVFDGDSGCVLQRGAAACQVYGNHWERCRTGLIAWGATALHEEDNHAVDLYDPAEPGTTGP
jgi:alpha-L-fucosidase